MRTTPRAALVRVTWPKCAGPGSTAGPATVAANRAAASSSPTSPGSGQVQFNHPACQERRELVRGQATPFTHQDLAPLPRITDVVTHDGVRGERRGRIAGGDTNKAHLI